MTRWLVLAVVILALSPKSVRAGDYLQELNQMVVDELRKPHDVGHDADEESELQEYDRIIDKVDHELPRWTRDPRSRTVAANVADLKKDRAILAACHAVTRIADALDRTHQAGHPAGDAELAKIDTAVAELVKTAGTAWSTPVEFLKKRAARLHDFNAVADKSEVKLQPGAPALPTASDPISARAVSKYFSWRNVTTKQLVQALFMQAPRELFVFGKTDLGRSGIEGERYVKKGEAVLILDATERGNHLVSIDGVELADVRNDLLATAPVRGAPVVGVQASELLVANDRGQAILGSNHYGASLLEQPGFLQLLDEQDPVRVKFEAAVKAAIDCYDRERDKLDPDHVQGDFDVVHPNGKVESLSGHNNRIIYTRCNLDAFEKKRDALEAKVIGARQAKLVKELQPAITRLRELFP